MSDEHAQLIDAGDLPDTGGSLRDRLRAKREELRHATTVDLEVPGYESELAVRYHAIPGDEFEKFARKIRGGSGLAAGCRLLIRCCECVLVRVQEEGDFEPLLDGGDQPLKFDQRLAGYLDFEASTSEEVVVGTFSPDHNRDLAPMMHANALVDWLRGREDEIDESLLGE